MTVQLTQEQFQELLGRISAIHSSAKMNFTQCPLRFYGERDYNKVDEFINAVTAFKQLEQIPDEDALFGLPLLLKDTASTWWAKVRSDVNSWTQALDRIRSEFAPRALPHEIYLQIFANPQGHNEAIDTFLNMKRQLLGMLPADRHTEEVQLDLIYGLLKLDLRKEILRSEVNTLAELADKARHLESLERSEKLTKTIRLPSTSTKKQPKKRCSFCSYKGHTAVLCRKRMAQLAEAQLKNKTEIASAANVAPASLSATISRKSTVDSPMSLTCTVNSTVNSPMLPTCTVNLTLESPMSPTCAVNSTVDSPMLPTADSPMSPTTSDEEPQIFCFGCGAPNVWKSICVNCKYK